MRPSLPEDVLIDYPEGQMFIFDNEEEVRLFWSSFGFDPEFMEENGVRIKTDGEEDEEEYRFEIRPGFVAPLLNPNPYFEPQDEYYKSVSDLLFVKPEDLILDPEVYHSYPLVGFFHFENGFDRVAGFKVRVASITPLRSLKTIGGLISEVRENDLAWRQRLNQVLEWEELRSKHRGF